MTEPKQRRKPRKYTDEFKQQLVELYRSGKRRCDICREYDIATSLFDSKYVIIRICPQLYFSDTLFS